MPVICKPFTQLDDGDKEDRIRQRLANMAESRFLVGCRLASDGSLQVILLRSLSDGWCYLLIVDLLVHL